MRFFDEFTCSSPVGSFLEPFKYLFNILQGWIHRFGFHSQTVFWKYLPGSPRCCCVQSLLLVFGVKCHWEKKQQKQKRRWQSRFLFSRLLFFSKTTATGDQGAGSLVFFFCKKKETATRDPGAGFMFFFSEGLPAKQKKAP